MAEAMAELLLSHMPMLREAWGYWSTTYPQQLRDRGSAAFAEDCVEDRWSRDGDGLVAQLLSQARYTRG